MMRKREKEKKNYVQGWQITMGRTTRQGECEVVAVGVSGLLCVIFGSVAQIRIRRLVHVVIVLSATWWYG